MANMEKIVPFILLFETGTTGEGLTNPQIFDKARKNGFVHDPDDLGGATMCGITLETYTEYCRKKGYPRPTVERLRGINYKTWADILKTMFWDRWKADRINSQSVAEMLVDFVWSSGAYGIRIPQKALGVKTDGIVGEITLAAVNGKEPEGLFKLLKSERLAFIDRICTTRAINRKFRKGWINRINSLKFVS